MKDKVIRKAQFLQHVRNELDAKNKHNRKSIERIASSYGITDKSEIKEYTELAIVLKARSISLSSLTVEEKYWTIVYRFTKKEAHLLSVEFTSND